MSINSSLLDLDGDNTKKLLDSYLKKLTKANEVKQSYHTTPSFVGTTADGYAVPAPQPSHNHAISGTYNHRTVSGSGYASSGTSPYAPSTAVWGGPSPALSPSWEQLLAKVVEGAVAEAMKEVVGTLKDLQEQIDEIWEALGEDE